MDRTQSPEREERLVLTLVGKTFAIYTQYRHGKREGVILKSNPREDDKREIGMIQDCVWRQNLKLAVFKKMSVLLPDT